MDGILNLDKPSGWTSHDVVARARRLIRQKRIGHAGTLDPLATGVLLLCIGQATRVAEYLITSDKTYLARIRLGVTTGTYDATGEVTNTGIVPPNTNEAIIQRMLRQFVGEIEQVPPMYSALKRKGVRLYKLARQGIEVDRAPRKVFISDIVLRGMRLPELTLEVHCSSGTYIRSLAHDIGQALGCGAHVAALTRQASGTFSLDQAISLAEFETAVAEERWAELLYPLDAALQDLPAVKLDAETTQRVRHGQLVRLPLSPAPACRAYDLAGKLVSIMIYRAETNTWQPDKVFT